MSWDVSLYNFGGSPPTAGAAALANGVEADLLGSAADVRSQITAVLPGVDWTDPTWGRFRGAGFTLEFNTGAGDPIDHVMVHARGHGSAVETLVGLAKRNGWSIMDWTTSRFLDLETPSQEGWNTFKQFRDRAARIVRKLPW